MSPRVSTRYSLRWRLPAIISGLIAVVLFTFSWMVYRELEATLVHGAGERAQRAADQIAGLLDGQRSLVQVRQLAVDPDVRRFLDTRTDDARERVRARLSSLPRSSPRRIEVWDNVGTLLLEVTTSGAQPDPGKPVPVLPVGSPPSALGVTPLQGTEHVVFTDLVAEIVKDSAAPGTASAGRLGYVRARVMFAENPPGIFSRLVGYDVVVRIGNRTGGNWTDFARMMPIPAIDLAHRGVAQYRDDGGMRVGAVSLIEATPWAAWVDFPMSRIVAPARRSLNHMLMLALLFVTGAAVVVTAFAARITVPLAEMTRAAAGIAAGDYSRRVTIGRRDEIGQLGQTFNAMAADVQAGSEALRQSEALFRGMAEAMPHIVWTAHPDGRFEYLNRQWVEYTGMTLEAMRRSDWPLVLHPDERAHVIEGRTGAFATGEPYEVFYRLKRARDGEYRWHAGRAAPLRNESGEIVMWVGTGTDIDDARRAADALKTLNAELEDRVLARTAALAAATQELEAFSYSVSHDLRAPLRHVQGYVEMLTASTAGQLSEKSQRYLRTIVDVTVEMGELIDDLLAFSQIGRAQLSEGRVSLDALVQDAISGLEMATRDRHIVWKIAPLPDAIGDPSLLKQVFANLLGNAVKYSRRRDPAEIEVGRAGEEDGRMVVFVRDNGAGFDMQYAHKLFGVFQRLHRADQFEGTGIGLATVRRIISRHGGRTWAEGAIDQGATIYFTLKPAARSDRPSPKADHELSEANPAR